MQTKKVLQVTNYITTKQKTETVKWNQERGTLKWDEKSLSLEYKMLSEEANEFFCADGFVDRMDAFLDFIFVATGTEAKFYSRRLGDNMAAVFDVEEEKIFGYIEKVSKYMHDFLYAEYVEITHKNPLRSVPFDRAVMQCYDYVLKGTEKDADGKVKKPENFVSPESMMRGYFESCGLQF